MSTIGPVSKKDFLTTVKGFLYSSLSPSGEGILETNTPDGFIPQLEEVFMESLQELLDDDNVKSNVIDELSYYGEVESFIEGNMDELIEINGDTEFDDFKIAAENFDTANAVLRELIKTDLSMSAERAIRNYYMKYNNVDPINEPFDIV